MISLKLLVFLVFFIHFNNAQLIRTTLDQPALRDVRKFILTYYMNSNRQGNSVVRGRENQILQNEYPKSEPFFCDAKNGPGKRSAVRPTSVNELRPGDIDIIAAIGDSITAGNGLAAGSVLDVLIENRGMSWSIGGQATWKKFTTLPNILKEFNPQLYGYSLKDSLSTDRASKFNVAEGGAMSRDMPYQAKVLLQRLKHDPKVNMTNDWKLLTILMGANDFCSDMCYYDDPAITVDRHADDLIKTLRYLRNNIPRLMVNVVIVPNITIIFRYGEIPRNCDLMHTLECPCLKGPSKTKIDYYQNLIKTWRKKDIEIIGREEFNTNEFTVNLQPIVRNLNVPKFKDGRTDYRFISFDCFHFTQKLHAIAAKGLWNNMLEPDNNKSLKLTKNKIRCPTEEFPYLTTRNNSIQYG